MLLISLILYEFERLFGAWRDKNDKNINNICNYALLAAPVTAANVTSVEIHGIVFDTNSSTYNTTMQWDAQKFPGFWYNLNGGIS